MWWRNEVLHVSIWHWMEPFTNIMASMWTAFCRKKVTNGVPLYMSHHTNLFTNKRFCFAIFGCKNFALHIVLFTISLQLPSAALRHSAFELSISRGLSRAIATKRQVRPFHSTGGQCSKGRPLKRCIEIIVSSAVIISSID